MNKPAQTPFNPGNASRSSDISNLKGNWCSIRTRLAQSQTDFIQNSSQGVKKVIKVGLERIVIFAFIFIVLLAFIFVPKLYKFLFDRKSRRFNKYLDTEEMKTIKSKYFDENISLQLIVMNNAIIDEIHTLCVFPLNKYASQLLDDKFLKKITPINNRTYHRFLFINTFFKFAILTRQFYTIKSPFDSETTQSESPDGEKEKLKKEWANVKKELEIEYNIEESSHKDLEEMSIFSDSSEETPIKTCDNHKKIPFDPQWLKEEKFNRGFLRRVDYLYSALYMCFLIRNFLVSKAIFGSNSEKFLVCFASPLIVELRIYQYREEGLTLTHHRPFDFPDANGLEAISYVLEELLTQTDGSELKTLLKSLDNSGTIMKMSSKKQTTIDID